jgi:tellurite resistance protein TerC
VSKEQFIVFTSNALAIMGLRSLYFLLADMHARFSALQEGLAIILAFVGIKMIISRWYVIDTAVSLLVIVLVLVASVAFSLRSARRADRLELPGDTIEVPPPPHER